MFRRLGDPTNVFTRLDNPLFLRNALSGPPLPVLSSLWRKRGEDGKPDGGFSNPYCYHIDQFESLRPVFMQVIEYCHAMGLDMIQGDHEDAPGQLELNWTFDNVVRNADRLSTTRGSLSC